MVWGLLGNVWWLKCTSRYEADSWIFPPILRRGWMEMELERTGPTGRIRRSGPCAAWRGEAIRGYRGLLDGYDEIVLSLC